MHSCYEYTPYSCCFLVMHICITPQSCCFLVLELHFLHTVVLWGYALLPQHKIIRWPTTIILNTYFLKESPAAIKVRLLLSMQKWTHTHSMTAFHTEFVSSGVLKSWFSRHRFLLAMLCTVATTVMYCVLLWACTISMWLTLYDYRHLWGVLNSHRNNLSFIVTFLTNSGDSGSVFGVE